MPALLGALADFFEKILVSKWMRLVVVRFLRGKRVAAMARGARRWRNYFLATSMALGSFAKVGAGARLAFHARGGLADSRRRATARLWRRTSRGSAAAFAPPRRAVECIQPLRGLLLGLEPLGALGSSRVAR